MSECEQLVVQEVEHVQHLLSSLGVWVLGFRFWCSGFRVWGSGVWGLGVAVSKVTRECNKEGINDDNHV